MGARAGCSMPGGSRRSRVYLDSPMAKSASDIYRAHPEAYDEETAKLLAAHEAPLDFPGQHIVQNVQESEKIEQAPPPLVIIASNGMLTGGRSVGHAEHLLDDPTATVLFVGYQGEGTLGGHLVRGTPTARIAGHEMQVRATIKSLDGFSAHADEPELLAWLDGFIGGRKAGDPGVPRDVYLVHGDPPAQAALAPKVARSGSTPRSPPGTRRCPWTDARRRRSHRPGRWRPDACAASTDSEHALRRGPFVRRASRTESRSHDGFARGAAGRRRIRTRSRAWPSPPAPRPPAPLSPDDIARIRAPFRGARLLPGKAYHDDEIFAWEREEIFYRDWLAVARAEELAEPGSFLVREVLDESVLLVRGRDDVIRAFYNVCRHRGTAVEERDCGQAVRFQCPYHAWIYDLDGKLIRAKHTEDLEDFTLRGLRPRTHPDRDLAGLRVPVLRRRVGDAGAAGLHGRLVRAPRELRPRHVDAPAGRAADLRRRRQLEDRGRELLRVLPLPAASTRCSTSARPTTSARTSWPRARGRAAGCRSPRAARRCR